MMEDLLKQILDVLKRMERKLDALGGGNPGEIPITDEKTLGVLKEYETRGIAEYVMRHGLPNRLPNECPECWEKRKKISKGVLVHTDEFKHSRAWTFKCPDPDCGHRWVAQIKT
ncbi:hypothetical protein ES703_74303 [subsurface metagenome]